MEDQFSNIEETLRWSRKYDSIIQSLGNSQEIEESQKPENAEEKRWIISNLEKYMSHNEEKYRDKEGREYYQRIKSFIATLE
ncbi:MAG: hypothetical protein WDN09_01405 [bacterium]